MATYLPGVQPFIPQTEVFTPDYKFLQDVLSTRQDRYDSNFKEINKLYGEVVYAPLSHEKNKEKRDQYANALSNSLKQVAGMDLSLAQNVTTAKSLFSPFYKDDRIVKDMLATKTYKNSMKDVDMLKNASNQDVAREYWTEGEEWVNYSMSDFINEDYDNLMKFDTNRLKYVKNPDIFNVAMEILDEANFDVNDFQMVNDYIIKIKNGPALTDKKIQYQDENGQWKEGTQNIAMDYVVNALGNDPRIVRGMRVAQQVDRRRYVDDNLDKFNGDKLAAGTQWDRDILSKQGDEDLRKLAELDISIKGDQASLANWEEYKKIHGIPTGSGEDQEFMKKQYEVALALKTKKTINDRLVNMSMPTENQKVLQQKAASAYIANNMQGKFEAAANAYANKTMSKDITPDSTRLNWAKFQHQVMQDERTYMQKEKELQLQYAPNAYQQITDSTAVRPGGMPTEEGTDPWALTEEGLSISYEDVVNDKADFIFDLTKVSDGVTSEAWKAYLANGETGGDYPQGKMWISEMNNGEGGYLSYPEARAYLTDPNNFDTLERIYQDTYEKKTGTGDAYLNDFNPNAVYTADEELKFNGIIANVHANENGLPGSTVGIRQDFAEDIIEGINYEMNLNPDSEFSQQQKIFRPAATYEGLAALESLGISQAYLNAGSDDVVMDPNSPNYNKKIWEEVLLPRAIESGIVAIDPATQQPSYLDHSNSFYEAVHSTPYTYRSANELVNAQIAQLSGPAEYDGAGNVLRTGKQVMAEYLNSVAPNGDNSFMDDSVMFTGENSLRSYAWQFDDRKGWFLDENLVEQYIKGEGGFYDKTKDALNNIWQNAESKEGTGFPTLTAYNKIYGQDPILGVGMLTPQISSTTLNDNPSRDALVNFEGLNSAMNQPVGQVVITQGDYLTTEMDKDMINDPIAEKFLREVLIPRITSEKDFTSKNPIQLEWVQQGPSNFTDGYGDEEAASVYKIHIPQKLREEYKNWNPAGIEGEVIEGDNPFMQTELFQTGNISVLVKQDLDAQVNNKHMTNQRPSAAERMIMNNYEYVIPTISGGGDASFYLDDRGRVVQTVKPLKYNSKANNGSGGYEPDTSVYVTNYIDPKNIDFAIGQTITALNQIKMSNDMARDQMITDEMKNINIEDTEVGQEQQNQ
jgi:hypothetical protein